MPPATATFRNVEASTSVRTSRPNNIASTRALPLGVNSDNTARTFHGVTLVIAAARWQGARLEIGGRDSNRVYSYQISGRNYQAGAPGNTPSLAPGDRLPPLR
jgi:hypothetical protein